MILIVISVLSGYIIGMILLLFFQDVIFSWLDSLVNWVRSLFNLPPF